jgi:Cys-rich protein (TIGR01571 family)
MTRLGVDFLGQQPPSIPQTGPWSTWEMMKLILSFWVFLNVLVLTGLGIKIVADLGISGADLSSLIIVNLLMFSYSIYATAAVRGSLREKYRIREHRFRDMEDCLCATFCMPCTICQMGRHTVSYEEHEGACFTKSGIQDVYEPAKSMQRETEMSSRLV